MLIILTFLFVVIDFISKIIVSKYLSYGEYLWLIKKKLGFTFAKNTGVAWSLFNDKPILVLFISLGIILGIIIYIYKTKPKSTVEKISYSLILGGAIGNLIDRIINGYVTDFISVIIYKYDYPIFNLADSFIVIGVIILIVYTWRNDRDGDKSRGR